MNAAIRAAILRPQNGFSQLKSAACFHSTPVLERKRRTSWEAKANVHNKRFRRMRSKQELLRNVNAFAAHMFTSWHDEFDYDDPQSRKNSSWFRKQYSNESKGKKNGKRGPQRWGQRHFDFCEADEEFDIDYIFHTAFGGSRGFTWSFINEEEEPRWQHSSRFSNNSRKSWRSKYRFDDEEEEEEEDGYTSSDCSDTDSTQASHRQALGLSPSGPLNLKDVKDAYRTCALKWHPDRHQGSTKTAAEAKFKLCSVAYQSLCEKLSVN